MKIKRADSAPDRDTGGNGQREETGSGKKRADGPGVDTTETNDTDNSVPQSGVDPCERRRGEELRQWQAQERAEHLKVLSAILSELARRLLMAHPNWEVQEQVHLDHVSLEARERPEAEAVVVECRWAEDARWRDYGPAEVSLARFTDFRVIGTPDAYEYDPDWPSHVMEPLVQEVELEVASQAMIAPEGVTRLAPRLP